jgi:hypothetical protein
VIEWSGQGWYERPYGTVPTIQVIDGVAETYERYHQRKLREKRDGKPRRVPFGFAQAVDPDAGEDPDWDG